MLSSQSPRQNYTSFTRTGTPVNNTNKGSPVFNEKRVVSQKSIRRRAESIGSPSNSKPSNEYHQRDREREREKEKEKEREREREREQEYRQLFAPPATAMHWTKIKPIGKVKPRKLRAHTMTLVGEKLFIFGGSDIENCFNDLYIFDCETYLWTVHKTKGLVPPPKACRAHSADLIGDYIYFFGGGNGPNYYNSLYLLNTKTLNWERPEVRGQIPNKRRAHTSWVYNDLLYIFAGGDGMCALNDVYVLAREETSTNSNGSNSSPATKITSLPSRSNNGYSDINNSMDNSLDSNSFGDNKDTYDSSMSRNGQNGYRRNDDNMVTNSRFKFVWTKINTTGKAPSPRGYHTSNLIGNKVVVYGGSDGHECFSEIYVLDLEKNHWTRVNTDRPIPRLSHTSTQVGSYLFVIGGHDGNHYSHSLLLLNLVTLRWEVRRVFGEKPLSRGYHTAILYDSRIFLFGGYDGHTVFNDMYVLDLSASAYLPQITQFDIGGAGIYDKKH